MLHKDQYGDTGYVKFSNIHAIKDFKEFFRIYIGAQRYDLYKVHKT